MGLNGQRSPQTTDAVVARRMHNAITLAEHGDIQQALQSVSVLLQQHPDFVPALKLNGMLLEAAGSNHAAAESYEKALRLSPSDNKMLLKVGVIALLGGDADRAIQLLTRVTRSTPEDAESFYYLAQAYHHKEEDEQAIRSIRRAATLAPDSASIAQKYGELLCSSGDYVKSLLWLNRAQHADPSLGRINFDLAVASLGNMDLGQAVTYASQETQVEPNDLDAFALLATVKIKLTDWTGAEAILQQVLKVRKDDPTLLMQLGQCELELKQYQLSVDTLQQALQLDPTLVQAHFFLSRAFAGQGNATEARHEAELHQRLMQEFSFEVPKSQQEHEAELLRRARELLSKHQEDEALQLFAKDAGQVHEIPAAAYNSVGATYLSMDNTEDGKRMLQRALTMQPSIKGAHTYLGIIALQQSDLVLADREFAAELAGDPSHPLALAELGEVRYRQARWSDAINFFLRSKTSTPQFLYMLTDCYFHLGNIQAANLTAESMAANGRSKTEAMHGLAILLIRNGQAPLADRLKLTAKP